MGTATTNSSGVATLASVSSLAGINAGDYRGRRRRMRRYAGQTASNSLTVSPAVATVTANAKSKTYGDDEPGARRGGGRRGQRRHARLQPGDDGGEVLGVGSYPITVTLGTQPELHGHQDRRGADGQPGGRRR